MSQANATDSALRPAGPFSMPYRVPRHEFSMRGAARSVAIWRAGQEAAGAASADVGWDSERFAREGNAFMVRVMTVLHHRETRFGEALSLRSWVRQIQRGTINHRETRIEGVAGRVASISQRWVHVDMVARKPCRAPEGLRDAYPILDIEGPVSLPDYEAREGATHDMRFATWHTRMDRLGHTNHPTYIEWFDEGTSRVMHDAGLDPMSLVPVADQITFKGGVEAPDEVTLRTSAVGVTQDGALVLKHDALVGERVGATGVTVRRLVSGDEARLRAAFGV